MISTQTMPRFSWLKSRGGIHKNFILASSRALYIYVRASFFGWLVSNFGRFQSFCLIKFTMDLHPLRHVLTSVELLFIHRLPSDVHWIFVLRPASCDNAPYILRLVVLRTILSSCLFIQHLFDFHPSFVRPSLDVRLTFVRSLCVTGHSQQRTVFFKLYFVLEFCS